MRRDKDAYQVRLEVFVRRCLFLCEHLEAKEFRRLGLVGSGILWQSKRYGYTARETWKFYLYLRKNNIRLIDYHFLNPAHLLKKVIKNIRWQ